MEWIAIKRFSVTECSTSGMWYQIEVRDARGRLVFRSRRRTMKEAQDEVRDAGYVRENV